MIEGLGDHGCEYMTGGVVLCLGKTGKNFGAGMSGGIAYVYDKEKVFSNMCNLSLIELSKLNNKKLRLNEKYNFDFLKANMLDYHQERIIFLIKKHLKYTNSNVARKLLENWDNEKSNFITVFPRDYRVALENINNKDYKLKKLGE